MRWAWTQAGCIIPVERYRLPRARAIQRLVSLDVSQTESENWTVSSVSYYLPKTERAS
jgi:hypothetical protein